MPSNGFFNVNADTRDKIHPFKHDGIKSFTFTSAGNDNKLGILPRFNFNNWKDDIGHKDTKQPIETILSMLPKIKIREYTQDLKITTLLNLVQYGVQGFKDAGDILKGMKASTAYAEVIKDEFSKFETYKKLFGDSIVGNTDMKGIKGDDLDALKLTYNLYYHVMAHTSTHYYELPFISKLLYETNGQDGWPSGPESGFGGTSSNSILGTAINLIGSNYKIVTEPIWKPISNSNGTNIELTIHLFNDTLNTSVANYLFVQLLTSHNMPLQYGIIQQPPSCYEINISGGKRLFMCSGKFSVSNIGVNRKVSNNVITQIKKYTQTDFQSSINQEYIRIPDIYEVKLTFKSLLPDVFNDFMYQFSMQSLDTMKITKEESVFTYSADKIKETVDGIKEKAQTAAKNAENKKTNEEAKEGAKK